MYKYKHTYHNNTFDCLLHYICNFNIYTFLYFYTLKGESQPLSMPLSVLMLDSTYRCNEYNRVKNLAFTDAYKPEKEIKVLKETILSTKNKKKKEALVIEINKITHKFNSEKEKWRDDFSKLPPDGYAIIECCTESIRAEVVKPTSLSLTPTAHSPPSFVVIGTTLLRPKIINSLFGGVNTEEALYFTLDIDQGRPSPYDYIQLPQWFVNFSPALRGGYHFVEDEVLLAMRQDDQCRAVLDVIEDDAMLQYTESLYDSSPLRDFSRQKEIREIDIERPGE